MKCPAFRSFCFNPCSFGCQSESTHTSLPGRQVQFVSILVLLDVSLKAGRPHTSGWLRRSFNPCSFGCQSERELISMENRYTHMVSILVLLDVSLKASVGERLRGRVAVSILVLLDVSLKAKRPPWRRDVWRSFNPCSFGCQSERAASRRSSRTSGSFNPCSFGCQSESVGLQGFGLYGAAFQSLFFWMSV